LFFFRFFDALLLLYFVLSSSILLFFLVQSYCLNVFALEAIRSSAILPTPRFAAAAAYDGDETIYVIGGYLGVYQSAIGEILRFNISSEAVEVTARFPDNQVRSQGSAVYDRDDDVIYYFGGADYNLNGQRNYWKINILQGTMASSSLSVWAWNGNTAIWDNTTDSAYLFGTRNPWDSSQVVQFSKATATFTDLLPGVPPQVLKFDFAVTVWDPATKIAYIMGGQSMIEGEYAYDRIFKWTAATGQLELLPTKLPHDILWTSGVWNPNNNCAYLIGTGYFGWEGGDNALTFCPSTNNITTFVVDNFPARSEETAAVYVEKLNRIYVFGGYMENSIQSNEIIYIDL